MVISKYTKLKPITKSPATAAHIVDFVDVKDYVEVGNDARQVVITYAVCVDDRDWDNFIAEQAGFTEKKEQAEEDKKLTEACETILKTDPFGGDYNNMRLIDIYKANFLWVEKALKEMKNTYIVNRLKIIKEAVENGKIDV